jgi:Cu-Zn family superoxide dismutase
MFKPVSCAVALLAATAALLSACRSNQQPTSPSSTSAPPGTERLTTQLKTADGTPVANATFDFANGYATVTVETVATHILTPGFHGFHIHSVGKCEANSVAPTGGPAADFASAGGHYQVPGHTAHPSSGDLTSLEVRSDGAAKLVTTTDAFTAADLRNSQGTALIIHQDPDNFGNIPSDRYTQKSGGAVPDQETLATGDSGKRVACGVIAATTASATTASATTATATPTPTGTSQPGGTATTTTVVSPAQPTETSTSTSTVTVTVPTLTSSPIAPPAIPGPPGNPAPPGGG